MAEDDLFREMDELLERNQQLLEQQREDVEQAAYLAEWQRTRAERHGCEPMLFALALSVIMLIAAIWGGA